jgi:uncharacterized protein YndB with AHSA1/START domain
MRMQVTHHFDADVPTVFALLSDPEFLQRKYADQGASDVSVDSHDERGGSPHIVSRRKVTIDLPGFAKKVMQPTNTVVQTDDWSGEQAGRRVCSYKVEVQGVPSRIDGTVTLSPDGGGTRQDVEAEVKVSIPLLGGKLEKLAVDSGKKLLEAEAAFTAKELAGA